MRKITVIIIFFFIFSINISPVISGYVEWSAATVFSSESSSDAYRQCVAIDKNDVFHVAWKDKSDIQSAGTDWDIFYKNLIKDTGWSPIELVTGTEFNDSICLSMAVDSNQTVHIAWKEQTRFDRVSSDWDIFYTYKTIYNNWSNPTLISLNSDYVCSCPTIAVDEKDTVHLSWADTSPLLGSGTDSDIYYTHKKINKDWNNIELVTDNSDNDTFDPFLTVDTEFNVHIVWYESISPTGKSDIIYKKKALDGEWMENEIVSTNCVDSSLDPSIVVDLKQNIHVVWNDNTHLFDNGADYDIFYRVKDPNNGWLPIELISATSRSNCKWPFIVIDKSNTVYVAWSDQTNYDDNGNDYDIVFTLKQDTKKPWEEIQIVSENSKENSNWPRFAIDSENGIHMTWWDETSTHWAIYYNHGKITNPSSNNRESSFLSITSIIFIVALAVICIMVKKRYYKFYK